MTPSSKQGAGRRNWFLRESVETNWALCCLWFVNVVSAARLVVEVFS